jgi:Zn finger protein HypA/HybF involved in hydrogenase expression
MTANDVVSSAEKLRASGWCRSCSWGLHEECTGCRCWECAEHRAELRRYRDLLGSR